MNLKNIYFLLLILSGMTSCNAQETKLKFPAFDNKGCSVTIPVTERFKDLIKEKDGFLQIDKSEFKDSTYMLYLPQTGLTSFLIAIEALNLKKTPTPLDFSKSIIKHYEQSINKVDSVIYKSIDVDEVGEVNKVSYKFITNGMYSVYYSFFLSDKTITIGYMYMDGKHALDTDDDIERLKFICP